MENNQERLLGAQEILFYAMNEASPKHFLIAAELAGPSERTEWQAAITLLQKAHPMLNRSIVAQDNNLVFRVSGENALSLDIADLTSAFIMRNAIEEELEKGFRSDIGPLARIKLFFSSEKCVVIVAAHHSIGDALSSVNLLNDLLGLLAGKSLSKFPLQQSVDEFLGYQNEGLAAKINQQIFPGQPLPYEFLKQHPHAKADILRFSTELTARLVTCAKEQHTTVHGAIQAAAALALKELSMTEGRPAYIMSPFSVRSEMHIGSDCGLFIDTKIVPVATDTSFWDTARYATAGLANVHSDEFLKSSAEQLRGLISSSDDLIQFIKDHFNFDIMLSNLGRLSLENANSKLTVNSISGPFIISGLNHQQAIGANTLNGQLTLTNASRYLVPGLLAMIAVQIDEACAA